MSAEERVRLQKFLAANGVASRRKCEELIAAGRVRVNGQIADQPGTTINPATDMVTLDGAPVTAHTAPVYYILNKPRGYLVSASDPFGRKTIYDLLTHIGERVVPVGRLDLDSEGLLLLTNDGTLAHRLMHPSFKVEKEYEVEVEGALTEDAAAELEAGVEIEGGITAPAQVQIMRRSPGRTIARITITEGRKRQVRQMLAAVGHPVLTLKRLREGTLELGTLGIGKTRALTAEEVAKLQEEVGLI